MIQFSVSFFFFFFAFDCDDNFEEAVVFERA